MSSYCFRSLENELRACHAIFHVLGEDMENLDQSLVLFFCEIALFLSRGKQVKLTDSTACASAFFLEHYSSTRKKGEKEDKGRGFVVSYMRGIWKLSGLPSSKYWEQARNILECMEQVRKTLNEEILEKDLRITLRSLRCSERVKSENAQEVYLKSEEHFVSEMLQYNPSGATTRHRF